MNGNPCSDCHNSVRRQSTRWIHSLSRVTKGNGCGLRTLEEQRTAPGPTCCDWKAQSPGQLHWTKWIYDKFTMAVYLDYCQQGFCLIRVMTRRELYPAETDLVFRGASRQAKQLGIWWKHESWRVKAYMYKPTRMYICSPCFKDSSWSIFLTHVPLRLAIAPFGYLFLNWCKGKSTPWSNSNDLPFHNRVS